VSLKKTCFRTISAYLCYLW